MFMLNYTCGEWVQDVQFCCTLTAVYYVADRELPMLVV